MNIHILTAPIGSGKSTLLLKWLKSNPSIEAHGFLSIHDRNLNQPRKLLLLPETTLIPFESEKGEIHVGKFKFLAAAFLQGIQQLKRANPQSTIVIDEIGKLEIQDLGFEPDLSSLMTDFKFETLIVVVRLGLLADVMQKYPLLKNAKINQGPWFPQRPKVYGLVLGGGRSSRMGEPKCFMNYHGVPQYIHMVNLMQKVIDGQVFVNVPSELEREMEVPNVMVDSPQFVGKGPISGVLTAHEIDPTVSWLVIGVDYPQLSVIQLNELFSAHQVSGRSVCFLNPSNGFLEPLVAIYSASDLTGLKRYFEERNESLRHFLGQSDVLILPLANAEMLTSIDNPAGAEKYQSQISTK
jgi:molybdopterin-guanine dinucleotide biosynthesis protein A